MPLDSFINDVIAEVEGHNISDRILRVLTYPPKFETNTSIFDVDDKSEFLTTHLPRLLNRVISICSSHQRSKLRELLRYCSLNSKPDLWLECMLINLKSSEVNILEELIFFIFEAHRLENVISVCLDLPAETEKRNLEQRARMICNIPTYVVNSFPSRRDLIFFDRTCFVDVVLSSVKITNECAENNLLFYAYLTTHLCLTGHSIEVMSYILNSPANSLQMWSKIFVRIQEKYMENCILPLLTTSGDYSKCISILSQLLLECNSCKIDFFMKLFRRLLFVRFLGPHNPTRTIFSALFKAAICLENVNSVNLVRKTNELLGLPSLRLWSDSTSMLNSSIERHVYTCQVMLSWLTDFRIPVLPTHPNLSLDSLLPDILAGISNHLASPRDEVRVLGMAIGEWISGHTELFPKSDEEHALKFEYKELDLLSKVRPYFVPLVQYNSEKQIQPEEKSVSTDEASTFVNEPKPKVEINWRSNENILDSDDDPDPEDFKEPSLRKLPRRPMSTFDDKGDGSQLKKPRYLRECLDGMLMSKTEDNSINLACTLAATDLIYSHPEAAKELAIEFARVLIHVQPPISSNQTEIDEARHKSLIAIGVVAPKECARYLTHEFRQSEYSIGQRLNILSALKSIACELAGGDSPKVSMCIPGEHDYSSDVNPKTRRLFRKVEKPAHSINRFGPLAGEFFFPLLHSIPQLSKGSVAGHFAHQDSCLLANLLASLATIYACARFSSCQTRMARELIELIPVLHRHPEPAVRRALFIAVGTVITTTPLNLLAAHPQILFGQSAVASSVGDTESTFLLNWLRASSNSETDSDCQVLASSSLLALVERLGEMKIS